MGRVKYFKLKGGVSHSYMNEIKISFEALPENFVLDNAMDSLKQTSVH